jgi:hypothetical protein
MTRRANPFFPAATVVVAVSVCYAAKYKTDSRYRVDGEYRGRFTPDAEYVLSGEFREDLGPLPDMPYRYVGDDEGYEAKALTAVPEPGVHPRVLMSPEDIVRIRAEMTKGEKAHPWFRIVWNDIKNAKPLDHHHGLAAHALVALVEEDRDMGRKLAEMLVEEARFREPMAEIFNTHPDMEGTRDNWYYYARTAINKVGGVYYRDAYDKGGPDHVRELAKKSVELGQDGDRHASPLFNSVLRAYDYIHPFMTDAERTLVRRVIAKLTAGRYTTGMELPGHWFINNHMSMGEDLLILHLAIEGEEGYDPRILKEYSPAVRNKLTYDVSVGGHLHEKCKGFLPERATLAIARRAGMPETGALPLLRHDHLKAMVWAKVMDSTFVPYGTPELGKRGEAPQRWWMGYGSGPWMDQFFNWAFLLKHVYPKDSVVDYFYKERLYDMGFGSPRPAEGAPLPKPRIRYTWRDLMLLTVTGGLAHPDGRTIDHNQDGLPIEVLARKDAYVDMPRGVAMSRSSWDKDALHVHYECRSDVYMTGHETPEAGDFNLVSHGVQWSLRREWYMDCFFRNMVLIDGKAGIYPNACGKLMQVEDNDIATTFISDATLQYNWWQGGKNFYEWHGAYDDSPLHMSMWKDSELLGRLSEPTFTPHMRKLNENYAGLDWGAWHGESRGPAVYHRWNHVDHVFRTLHMTKGDAPYVLIVDDVRRDDAVHQYDWCLHLERDIVLCAADSGVRGRTLPNLGSENRDIEKADLILCLKDLPETRYDRYGIRSHRKPAKGDPMLLVRVLWRNTDYAFPQPVFEEGQGNAKLASRVRIPSLSVDPEFRVLLFPHRHGEKLPLTSWNADRTQLTVFAGGHRDVYTFGRTDRERSVMTMVRDGKQVARTGGGSASPQLDTPHRWTVDQNHPDRPRVVVLAEGDRIAFRPSPLGQVIRYTTDGAEPTDRSALYRGPILVSGNCTLKARTFARYWPFDEENASEALELRIRPMRPIRPMAPDLPTIPGLACEVFEQHHTWFDERTGLFTGRKKMLPELTDPARILACITDGFENPAVEPKLPAREMAKGYYRYTGFMEAVADGIHGFRVHSCGPVVLTVAGQSVIDVSGTYGLSLKSRYGQAALKAGRHPFELIVCDPAFWRDGRDGPYAIEVGMLTPGDDAYRPLTRLSTDRRDLKRLETPVLPVGKAVKTGETVCGLVMRCFDRVGLADEMPGDGLPVAHLDPGDENPYATLPVMALEPSESVGRLVEYTGYLVADIDGEYEFELDIEGANQLWVDGVLVQQNRVNARRPTGAMHLDRGLHALSLRLVKSSPLLRVKAPGQGTFAPATIGMFERPAEAQPQDDGRLLVHLDGAARGAAGDLVNPAGAATAHLRKGAVVAGRDGPAMQIRGEDSHLAIEGLKTAEDALSVSFWMRIDKKQDRGMIDNSWGSHPGARLRHTTIWASYFRGGPNAEFDLRKVGADKGEWFHVAITYGQAVRLYVNGELRDWQVKDVAARRAYVSDLTLFRGLEATVDDLRIHNKALTEQEVGGLAR